MSISEFSEERCVMCGEIIAEGEQVCPRCVKAAKAPVCKGEPEQPETKPSFLASLFRRK